MGKQTKNSENNSFGPGHIEGYVEARSVNCSVSVNESSFLEIVKDIDLTVAKGQYASIVGPSGCGKTTFLNMIAGLRKPTAGTLLVGGSFPAAGSPDTSYALARDALLPWRTALDNVTLPLELRGIRRSERKRRAHDVLSSVGLTDAAGRYRAELSQGMRQRVALARAIVTEPQLLLLDEPFGALDAQTRVAMQDWLLGVLTDLECTVVLVTHDISEAITFGDKVFVFSQKPCVVKECISVDIPRPREATELRHSETFQSMYGHIWQLLANDLVLN